jgi:hypothetical protein
MFVGFVVCSLTNCDVIVKFYTTLPLTRVSMGV